MENVFEFVKRPCNEKVIFGIPYDNLAEEFESFIMNSDQCGKEITSVYYKGKEAVCNRISFVFDQTVYELYEVQPYIVGKKNGEIKFVEYNQYAHRDLSCHSNDYYESMKNNVFDTVICKRFKMHD
jgi:hypothetical protein